MSGCHLPPASSALKLRNLLSFPGHQYAQSQRAAEFSSLLWSGKESLLYSFHPYCIEVQDVQSRADWARRCKRGYWGLQDTCHPFFSREHTCHQGSGIGISSCTSHDIEPCTTLTLCPSCFSALFCVYSLPGLLVWCSPICLFFSLISLALGDISGKIVPKGAWDFTTCFLLVFLWFHNLNWSF